MLKDSKYNKKPYIAPIGVLISFDEEDIIMTSGNGGDSSFGKEDMD